mmetsp:Transcript_12045/g.30868  ORF Transcript_12045/g.30868 Transcript_12045/m.30868 type:complete len:85 (+) Transcript_12045:398-652(+)
MGEDATVSTRISLASAVLEEAGSVYAEHQTSDMPRMSPAAAVRARERSPTAMERREEAERKQKAKREAAVAKKRTAKRQKEVWM